MWALLRLPLYERMGAHYAGFAPSKSIPGRMLPRMQMELEALSLPLAPLMPEFLVDLHDLPAGSLCHGL